MTAAVRGGRAARECDSHASMSEQPSPPPERARPRHTAPRLRGARPRLPAHDAVARHGRDLHGLPAADLQHVRLGPRADRLGLFDRRALRRPRRAVRRPAVRSLRAARRLRDRPRPDRRGIFRRGLRAAALAAAAVHRARGWPRQRVPRSGDGFAAGQPLVRPAPADRAGGRRIVDGRGRPAACAARANPCRLHRLARRLSHPRRRDAGGRRAAAAAAMAADHRRSRTRRALCADAGRPTTPGRSAAPCVITHSGRCSASSSSPAPACFRSRCRSSPIWSRSDSRRCRPRPPGASPACC